VDLLILAGGLALLLLGGYALVQGASGLASSFGVSQIVIGLTVVAFGTSAPELAVNLTAALRGSSGLSFGNVIGSNLANLGLILGTAALVRPLVIESRVVAREIPMMLLATSAVAVLGLAADLSLRPGSYDRADGSVLLLLFGVFIYNAVRDVLQARRPDAVIEEARMTAERREPRRKRIQNGLLTLLGLAGLYLGGELTVAGATGIARSAGLSEAVIGLTVVAVGTSLPELVTSIIAAGGHRRRQRRGIEHLQPADDPRRLLRRESRRGALRRRLGPRRPAPAVGAPPAALDDERPDARALGGGALPGRVGGLHGRPGGPGHGGLSGRRAARAQGRLRSWTAAFQASSDGRTREPSPLRSPIAV
jgi:cation:H+ antiporter